MASWMLPALLVLLLLSACTTADELIAQIGSGGPVEGDLTATLTVEPQVLTTPTHAAAGSAHCS
jgi:hypothetical protein